MKTALQHANAIEFPVLVWSGVGCPAGERLALLEETNTPCNLDEVQGSVQDLIFSADLVDDVRDIRGNTITKLQIYNDREEWTRQNDDYNAEI